MAQILINTKNTNYNTIEAYRTIRTNLRLCGDDRKVVAVTSCIPGEGKSRVSIQLAQALCEDRSRVVVVDADLRKSGMLRNITLREECKGLSHFLSGQCPAKEIISGTDQEGLSVITSGPFPPNPTELLRTDRFHGLIRRLREEYDYVIIDTPPLGSVIDSVVIAEACDGILWVVSYGQISRGMALDVKSQMDRCACPVLGVILNKTQLKDSPYYSRYYKKYYGDSEKEHSKQYSRKKRTLRVH